MEDIETKDEKRWCVYCHTNKINGKKYIGITSQKPEQRWNYGYGYRGCPLFWNAIQKYGWENFDHKILLKNLTHEEACKNEQKFIEKYKSNNNEYGYNLTAGGEATYGWVPSEEWREKISKALKGKFVGENNPNYGNHKLAGENNPMYGVHRYGETAPNYGKKMSEEQKEKISKSKKSKYTGENSYWYGKHHTEESKEKISKSKKERLANKENHPMYGKHHSEETKEKLRQANKGKNSGVNSTNYNPVYCIQLDEIFWGATNVEQKYGFKRICIKDCCKGRQKSAYKDPKTGEKLNWLYASEAIEKGYITQQDLDDYLNSIKNERN